MTRTKNSLLISGLVAATVLPLVAEISVRESGHGGDHRMVVANDFLEINIEPPNGGRIKNLKRKPNGSDSVHPHHGFLLDMFMLQSYPGEFQNAPYEAVIIDDRPARVGVRLMRTAGRAPHEGLRIEKTVWVVEGERSLNVSYRFLNTAGVYRSFSYWTQHFAKAGDSPENDLYLRPAVDRLDIVPFPGGDEYVDVVERPGAGWMAVVDPEESTGTAILFDFNYLRWLYNAFPAATLEWFTDQITLGPGQSWDTEISILPFAGFDRLSFASTELLADASVERKGQKSVLTHRLMAVNQPLKDVRIHTEVRSVEGNSEFTSLSVDTIGIDPVDIDQQIPLPDSGRQATILISLGDDGSLGRYFVNMPDSDGNADKLAPLRPAPEKVKQYPDRPEDFTISRDDKLDVLLLAGPGAKRFRIDDIGELNPPGEVRWSWYNSRVIMNARSHGVDYFPGSYDELASFDAVIFAGLGPYVLEDFSKHMLHQYMTIGGRVLILGGGDAMNGWTGAGNPLAKGFPIREPAPFQIRAMPRQEGMKPGVPEFEDLFSGTEPVVPFAHAMDLLPGTTILLTIGEEPLLVEQEIGDGKILVFLGTAYGPDSEDAFWNWPKWPHLLERVLYQ